MKLRKREKIFIGAGLLVVAVVCTVKFFPSFSDINERNYKRIENGMTEAEVCRLLGGPPRDESGKGIPAFLTSRMERREFWRENKYSIVVFFSDEGLAVDKLLVDHRSDGPVREDPGPIYTRLMNFFGIQRVRE